MAKGDKEKTLTDKQRRFCEEYCIDWNATRAATVAGYSKKTAYSIGQENLKKPEIKKYVDFLRKNLSEAAGISALWVVNEYKKQVIHGITDINEDWITRKEFEDLSQDVKDCIKKIETKVVVKKENEELYNVEMVKVEFYDKQTALKGIRDMLGYDKPAKKEISGPNGSPLELGWINAEKMTTDELKAVKSLIRKHSEDGA